MRQGLYVPVRLSVPSCAGAAAGLLPLAGGQETSTDSGGHPTAAARRSAANASSVTFVADVEG